MNWHSSHTFKILVLVGMGLWARPAHALPQLPFDPSNFGDLNNLVKESTVKEVANAVGAFSDSRPFSGATPLGNTLGLDVGIEVSIIRVPPGLGPALEDAGLTTELPTSLPIPRLHLSKGLGKVMNIGVSWLGYQENQVYGGHIQWAVHNPEEGLVWAFRVGGSYAVIGFANTITITPALLVSKKMSFAEPYMGVAYQHIRGTVSVETGLPAPLPQTLEGKGNTGNFVSYLGVGFVLGPTAIKISLEGSYHSSGAHSLGTKIGLEL